LSGSGSPQTHATNPNEVATPNTPGEASASRIHGGSELVHEPEGAAERTGMNEDPRNVLNELITLLMRNRVLTELEGKNLLRKLMTS
jgi:hypothetical protein